MLSTGPTPSNFIKALPFCAVESRQEIDLPMINANYSSTDAILFDAIRWYSMIWSTWRKTNFIVNRHCTHCNAFFYLSCWKTTYRHYKYFFFFMRSKFQLNNMALGSMNFPVCKSDIFAQSQLNFARTHICVSVTFRNSDDILQCTMG